MHFKQISTSRKKADRRKKVELIPGQAKILKYLQIMKPAQNLPGTQSRSQETQIRGSEMTPCWVFLVTVLLKYHLRRALALILWNVGGTRSLRTRKGL